MKAFVTGATGFVGSHLVEALLERGHDVACLVRDAGKAHRLFPDARPQLILGALDNEAALQEGCEGAEVIYHVAGVVAARGRREFFGINRDATERLNTIAGRTAPGLRRFVYVSSLAAAGPSTRGHPLAERAVPNPVSAYGASKLAAEECVRAGAVPWTIVRPPIVYGPRDREVERLFRLLRWGVAPVLSAVDQELSLIHVRDLVTALIHAGGAGAESGTYFASHAETLTASGFARAVHRAVLHSRGRDAGAGPRFVRLPTWVTRAVLAASGTTARLLGRATLLSSDKANDFLAEAWTCSPDALMRDTGWTADVAHEPGLIETAAWLRSQGRL